MATTPKRKSVEEMTPEEREAEHVRLLHEAIEAAETAVRSLRNVVAIKPLVTQPTASS
jgi:hypothetical protein